VAGALTRRRDRPVELVKLLVLAEPATLASREVLRQLEAMWKLFDIHGAGLPSEPGA
jgi:hypothetical protein